MPFVFMMRCNALAVLTFALHSACHYSAAAALMYLACADSKSLYLCGWLSAELVAALTGILLRNLGRFPKWKPGNCMTELLRKLRALKIWADSCRRELGSWLQRTYRGGLRWNKKILSHMTRVTTCYLAPGIGPDFEFPRFRRSVSKVGSRH